MSKTLKDNVVLDELVVTYMNVNDIKPNAYNPNRQSDHEFELLCRSIEEDGFTQPCVVRRADSMIVDGEHRWRAAQSIGMTEIPVVLTDMTDAQMRIATLRHNRARGTEDHDLAASVLKDLAQSGHLEDAADSLMLDSREVDKFLNEIDDPEALNIPELAEVFAPFKKEDGTLMPRHEVIASTPAASDAMRKARDMIAELKSDQDQAAFLKEVSIFKLSLTFVDEEAQIVRDTLGKNVAEGILAICTKEFEERGLKIEDL